MKAVNSMLVLIVAAAAAACGGGGSEPQSADVAWVGSPAAASAAEIQVLMMGNSHTHANDLPAKLDAMLRSGLASRSVGTGVAPGSMFLDERINDAPSMNALRSRPWEVVVLQAQRYSSSGQYTYSTREAEMLAAEARQRGALPVMFPEWPRAGIDETQRIYDLHVGIATASPACVAPVPQAYDLAAQRLPGLVLHAADGNHSSPTGAYLAALVLYATATGGSPLALSDAAPAGMDAATQQALRQVAADTVVAVPARRYCPGDVPLLPAAP